MSAWPTLQVWHAALVAGSLRMVMGLAAAGGEMSGALARLIWERTSRQGRLDQSLRRLMTAGKIVMVGEGPLDDRILRITTSGRRFVASDLEPPKLWARPWDGVWRVVAFDIPESATALRTRLRRRLHEHRFGWLQNSVWISPDPLDEFRARLCEQNTVPDSLSFFEAKPVGGERQESLVNSAWDFEALSKVYTGYFDILRLRPGRARGVAAWLSWLDTEDQAWRKILRLDPFLPEPLIPRTYRGREAWAARLEALKDFSGALSSAAGQNA